MATSVCRVCLVGNTRMLNIDNVHLLEMYEKLTDTKLHTEGENGLPSTVCYVCHRQLQKCHRFSHVAHKSNRILQDMLLNGTEITQNVVTMQSRGMHNLSVSPTKYIYMDPNNENTTEEQINNKNTTDIIEQVVVKKEVMSDSEETETFNETIEITDITLIKTQPSINNDMYNKITQNMSNMPSQEINNSSPTEYISVNIDSDTINTIASIKIEPDILIEEEDTNEEIKKTEFETYNKDFEGDLSNNRDSCDNNDSVKHKHSIIYSGMNKKNKSKLPRPFTCNLCGSTFTHKHTLKNHMVVHSGERLHPCDKCDRAFTQKSNLVTHMLVHTGEKPYPCSGCDKAFSQKSTLTTHMLIHTGEKPYSCGICDKAFAQKSNLQKHMLVHSGEKPFSCKRCDKVFGCKSNLTKHFLVHSGEKPFTCNVCFKSFTQKSTLTLHMLVHTGEKPFCCQICDKAYTCRSNLTKHMLVHSGIRPHSCNICLKSFTQKSTLTTHMQLMHSGETSCSS